MASDETKAPQLDFNALVLSFGSSVIVHLGEAPDPSTGCAMWSTVNPASP